MGETKVATGVRREMSAIDELRAMVRAFDFCNEGFLSTWTTAELLAIWRAWGDCEWDMFPDQWSTQQALAAAGRGEVPRFEENAHGEIHALGVSDCRCGMCRDERTRVAPEEVDSEE